MPALVQKKDSPYSGSSRWIFEARQAGVRWDDEDFASLFLGLDVG